MKLIKNFSTLPGIPLDCGKPNKPSLFFRFVIGFTGVPNRGCKINPQSWLAGKLDETCRRQEQDIIHLKRALKEREEGPRIYMWLCPHMGHMITRNSNLSGKMLIHHDIFGKPILVPSHPDWWVVKFEPYHQTDRVLNAGINWQ